MIVFGKKKKKNILVVDDNLLHLQSIVDLLDTVGRYNIISATNSKDAFSYINQGNIDVLITDFLLGKTDPMNGDKIISTIRDQEKRSRTQNYLPCILITGTEGERQMVGKMVELNASFHSKDDDYTQLVKIIEERLQERAEREKMSFLSAPFMRYFVLPLAVGIVLLTAGKIWKDRGNHLTPESTNINRPFYIGCNVYGEDGRPLLDAKILIDGSSESATTDSKGFASFNIDKGSNPNNELVLTILKNGYEPLREKITLLGEKKILSVKLIPKKMAVNNKYTFIGINVYDTHSLPIQNVQVILEGSSESMLTDGNGYTSFRIKKENYLDGEAVLAFFKNGFTPLKRSVSLKNDRISIVINLTSQ